MPKSSKQKRRKGKVIAQQVGPKKDKKVLQFEALPIEIICHVFSYLKLVDLLRCGQVSKRFRSYDQYLWPKKINLCYKNVSVVFLQRLLDSGCKYLSLCEAFLKGTLNLQKVSSLKYLNLDAIKCDPENSEKLLEYCYSLEKLSLSEFYLSSKLIRFTSLQNGKTLRVLDLSYCTFYREYTSGVGGFSIRGGKNLHHEDTNIREFGCIRLIVRNCTELKELSLYNSNKTKLHKRSIDFLVSNLTTNIEKLDLYNQNLLRDRHVKKLLTRCNKITELNLGGTTLITKKSLNFIVEHLQETLVQLNLEGTGASFDCAIELFKLRSMKKLRFLCIDQWEDWNHCVKCRELKEQLINNRGPCFPFTKPRQTRIAIPRHPGCGSPEPRNIGFWEINADQEELFSDCSEDEEEMPLGYQIWVGKQ